MWQFEPISFLLGIMFGLIVGYIIWMIPASYFLEIFKRRCN